ncbi:MAG: type IX secretion system membrane protein PorP/SprF [Flavobacteriales bacterium]|nr:type IX secretion system membrane protein PorP/SprF [Flavobacteriales bacterium]
MKRYILLTLLAFSSVFVYGQQKAQFTQNMFNKLDINPGYAGTNGAICATLIGRNQWTNFSGAPKTALIAVDMPLKVLHGGVGLVVLSDRLGPEETIGVKMGYSFIMRAGPGKLGIGVDGGVIMKTLGKGGFIATQDNDPTVPIIPVKGTVPDVNVGLYYTQSQLYFGIAASHLLGNEVYGNDADIQFDLKRHFYVAGGYNYFLTPSLELKPSIFAKTDGTSMQFDFNVNVKWNNQFWGGFTYRPGDALSVLLGLNITPLLQFGYAYDFHTTELGTLNIGTHEIMLGYCFLPQKKKTMKYKNVRYL